MENVVPLIVARAARTLDVSILGSFPWMDRKFLGNNTLMKDDPQYKNKLMYTVKDSVLESFIDPR